MRWLLARGLLVPIDDDTVELPREVGLAVRGARALGDLRADAAGARDDRRAPGRRRRGRRSPPREAVAKVEALLEAWTTDPPAVLRAGGLGVRELSRAAKDLDTDEAHAALLVEVAAAAGLLDARRRGSTPSGCRRRRTTPGWPGRPSSAGPRWRRPGSP